jgi:hypothetical protein
LNALTGNDANPGTSWELPLRTLDKAFALAIGFDDADTIRVTEGIYVPGTPSQPGDPKSKSFLFTGEFGLIVLGGYPAVGPQSNEIRDPAAFVSVLSADINQDDPAEIDDNSYQPVWFEDASDDFRLDGFRIERGIATNVKDVNFRYRSSGGGVYAAQTVANGPLDFVLQNCTIRDNVAREGGGLFMIASGTANEERAPSIRCCSFFENEATRFDGGAIWSDGLSPELIGCLVVGNTSDGRGAILLDDPGSSPPARIESSTIAFNRANGNYLGVQIFLSYFNPPISPGLQVRNSVIVRAISEAEVVPGATLFNVNIDVVGVNQLDDTALTIDYSNVAEYSVPGNPTNPDLGDFNLSFDDVVFADEGLPGAHAEGDFRLRVCSPLIDAGTSTALAVDLYDADTDHNFTEILPARDLGARVLLASIDMGAFETGVVVDHDCPGDMNGDGCVDATDLALLLGAWGACPLGCQGDFDCSGGVGAADLAVLLGAFGQCCSSGEGGAGGQMMASASSSGGLLTPALAAELFGFDSIDAFAAWLGSLPTTERNALLFALFTESGGDL